MNVRMSRMEGGLRLITSEIGHVESVCVGIWSGAGSRRENDDNAGISHFIEHLLFKGTRRRSARDISQAIEGRGGYLNAFTQEENTCYYARMAYDHVGIASDVLSDMYMDPRFAEQDIKKERGVILEEIMMYRDQPQHMVHEVLGANIWPGHSLGRPIIGTTGSLESLDRARIMSFKKRNYVGPNTVVSIAGRISHEQGLQLVARLSGSLDKKNPPGVDRFRKHGAAGRISLQHKDIEQTHMALGLRIFGRSDDRRYALRVLNAILGENMSSRLFQVVREKHGLAYSVHSSIQLFQESGALVIGAGLDRTRTMKAIGLIVRELTRLRTTAVGQSEFRRAKDYVIGQMRLGLESTTNQMLWMGENIMNYGRFVPPEEVIARISAVSREDVQSLASGILDGKKASIAIISPSVTEEQHEAIRDILLAI